MRLYVQVLLLDKPIIIFFKYISATPDKILPSTRNLPDCVTYEGTEINISSAHFSEAVRKERKVE